MSTNLKVCKSAKDKENIQTFTWASFGATGVGAALIANTMLQGNPVPRSFMW